MKTKSSKRVVEYRIDSASSCNVIPHSLNENTKIQESKTKLWMYDRSIMIAYGALDIKFEVNRAKTKLQFQVIDFKNGPLLLVSDSIALNLVMLNVSNGQVNDEIDTWHKHKKSKWESKFKEKNIGRI